MNSYRALLALLVGLLVTCLPAGAQKLEQKTFPTPEAAFEALTAACRDNQIPELLAILGPGSRGLIESGDPVADKENRADFARSAQERTFYARSGDAKVVVNVGFDNWPLPIPLVRTGDAWRFDTAAGQEELLDRRIGRNELATIDTCRAIVAAQREYYLGDLDGNGLLNYAVRITSTPGKRDGLYWAVKPGQPQSPLGPLVAEAQAEGYQQQGAPYHGYRFRILREQGPHAKGGAFRYAVNGNMVAGFAVLAWPADYGSSGLTTFMVGANGVLLQKDLGPKTDAICRGMTSFDPDASWRRVR